MKSIITQAILTLLFYYDNSKVISAIRIFNRYRADINFC
jgi:alkylhydroperoxidase/carboxymuconolactone decarboxylase family protein YurZ